MASSEFDSEQFEKRLHGLKDSQESIQSLSTWCLERRIHHKKIVATWLQVLRKVKVEHRLTLFYLANDVIQYSKRKNYDFVGSWGTTLQRATTLVRDEKVKHRILRIFKIWDQRQVYDEEFLTDLSGLISAAPKKKVELQPTNAPEEFQPTFLISTMRSCSALEQTTDMRLQEMRDNNIDIDNSEELCVSLKDRRKVKKAEKEVDLAVKNVENYICALESEIRERIQVLDLLEQADQYYETQRSEVKIVTNAYRNFGSRVKTLKKKLDELLPTLSSPIPSPDVNAPSPSPDSDIELPDEDHNQSLAIEITLPSMYGSYSQDYEPMPVPPPDILEKNNSTDFTSNFSSFIGTNVDFDMRNLFSSHSVTPTYNKAMPIEVINMRPSKTNGGEEFNSSFIKNVFPATDTAQSSSGIPGLGLDVPESQIESPQRPDYSQPSSQMNNSTTTSRIMAVHGSPHTAMKNLTSHSAPLSHVLLSYSNKNNQNNIMPFEKSSPNTTNPLPPPPLPPTIFLDNDGCYNKLPPKFPTWTSITEEKNLNSSWSSENGEHGCWESRNDENWSNRIQTESCLSETPNSPPIYEKSSFRKPVQYNGSQTEDQVLSSATDVDHRVILIPVPSEDHLPHRLMKGADVDHRNLISLTGSPANNAANTNEALESNINTLWAITDQDYRRQVQLGDIVESVDMEMSDDETDGVKQKSRILVDIRSLDKDMRAGLSQQTSRQMDLEMSVVPVNHGQISNNVQESFPPLSLQPCEHSQTDFAPNRDDFRPNNQELSTDQENFRPDVSSSAFMQNQPAFPSEFSVPPEFHHLEIYDFSNNQQQSRISGKSFHDGITAQSRYPQSQEHLHLQQQQQQQHHHHHHHHHRESTVFYRGRGRFLRNRRDRFNENCNSRRYRRQDQLENNAENITNNQTTFLQPPETCVIYDDNGIPIMPDSTLDEVIIQNEVINEIESEKSGNVNDTKKFETDEQIPELKVLVNSKETVSENRVQESSVANVEEPSQNLSEHFEALMNSGKTTGVNELTRQSTNGSITDQKDKNVRSPSKARSLLQNGPPFSTPLVTNELHPVIIHDYENQHITSPTFRQRLSSPVTGSIPSPRRGGVHQPHCRGTFRGSPRVSWTDRGSRGPPSINYMSRGNNRGSPFWGSGNFSGGASGFRGRGRGTNTW